jgi:cellulose 1,4-beta-cellobiosidase
LLAGSLTGVVVLAGAIGVGAASASISPAVSIHGTNRICANDAHIDTVERVDIRNNDDSGNKLCLTVYYHKPNFQITTSDVHTNWGAYPNAFVGCEISVCSPHSGLPMQVSNIKSAVSSWHYHPGSGTFVGNAAYDIWFDPKPITSGQVNHGAEIMIWLDSKGVGSPDGTPVYIDGAWYDYITWTAGHGGRTWNYVRFWRQNPTLQVTNLNLKNFFQYTENHHLLSSKWYLTGIETGYEICRGGYGIHTLWYSASVTPWKAPKKPAPPKPKPKPTPTIPSAPKPTKLPTPTPTPTAPSPSSVTTTPPTDEPTTAAPPTDAPTPTDTPSDVPTSPSETPASPSS